MEGLTTAQDCYVQKTKEEEEEIARCYERYTEMVTSLPKETGWVSEVMVKYGGFWFRSNYGFEGMMWTQQHFKARPSDIFLITNAKSGTTWIKALVFSILNRNKFDFSSHPLLTHSPHELVPFLELNLFRTLPIGDPEILPSPRIFASHIPYSLLPQNIIDSGCKIIHVSRDPKDAFVSLWHFLTSIKVEGHVHLSLEEAFDLFCKGISQYGPYWDLTLEYWKASLECPERLLFLKYEDMMEDTLLYVKSLAHFLGQPFTQEEEENGMVREIVKLCSFESLSNMEMVNKSGVNNIENMMNKLYYRKGVTGDWKNHLTPEMGERLDQITENKLKGSGLTFQG